MVTSGPLKRPRRSSRTLCRIFGIVCPSFHLQSLKTEHCIAGHNRKPSVSSYLQLTASGNPPSTGPSPYLMFLCLASSADHHDNLYIDLPLVSIGEANGYELSGHEYVVVGKAYAFQHTPSVACCSRLRQPDTQHIVHGDPSPLQTCRDFEAMPSVHEGKVGFSLCLEIPAACPQLGHRLL